MPVARFSYRLKRPWHNGTTNVILHRLELLARLAVLVPAPCASMASSLLLQSAVLQLFRSLRIEGVVCGHEKGPERKNGTSSELRLGCLDVEGFEIDVLKPQNTFPDSPAGSIRGGC